MIYALLALYLVSGYGIWRLGTSSIGGRDGYIEYLLEKEYKYPQISVTIAEVLVIIFWPYFVIKGIVEGGKDEE